jgi:hypothetical protein
MATKNKYFPCNFSTSDLNNFGTSIGSSIIPNVSDWPESFFVHPQTQLFYLNETYFNNLINNLSAALTYDLPSDLKSILTSFLRKLCSIKEGNEPINDLYPYGFDFIE